MNLFVIGFFGYVKIFYILLEYNDYMFVVCDLFSLVLSVKFIFGYYIIIFFMFFFWDE